ncbi:MAG: Bax inhibitor-1/YccA family protein [Candidatus Puniceispirillaceae bacterium]
MQNNRYASHAVTGSTALDAGLRSYMLGVYNHMTTALALTGFTAFGTKMLATNSPAVGQLLFGTPLSYVIMFAPLAMVMWMSFRINKMSPAKARTLFYIYAAMMGISLSTILLAFTGASVARAFFITAGAFAGLSIFGYTTKRDLTAMGGFLIVGVFGLILASIVNIFVQSSGMEFLISIVGVLLFAGLTAYDTQKIKSMYYAGDSRDAAARKSIFGALTLYLDFINMFLFMVQLLGNRE